MVKVRRYDLNNASSINEDAIFGGELNKAQEGTSYSPNAILNSKEAIIIGPDKKTYNMQGIKDNLKFVYNMIVKEYPALSYFISLLKPVYTFDVPTMATDGFHIFINPYFYVKLQSIKPFLAPTYVILHELYHNLLCHFRREQESGGKFPNHLKCNYAQDEEINNMLERQDPGFKGLTKLIGGICDYEYAGMMWEDIYPLLKDEQMQAPPQPQNGQGQPQPQNGQGQSGQSQSQQGQNGQGQPQQGQNGQGQEGGESQDGQNGQPQQGQGGQGQSGTPSQGQSGTPSQGQGGQSQQGQQGQGGQQGNEVPEGTGVPDTNEQGRYSDVISKSQGQKIAERAGVPYTDEMKNSDPSQVWEKAIQGSQAEALADIPSNGQPGQGLYAAIKKIREMFKPSQDWKKVLAKYMNEAFFEEDVKFPQKKYISSGRYKRYEDEVGEGLRDVALLFDASGSVWGTRGAHEQFMGEISEIFRRVHIGGGIIAQFADGIDTKNIVKFKKKLPKDPFGVTITGGTNYDAALSWANDYFKKSLPGCVIIFTDDDIIGGTPNIHYKWMDKKLIWFVVSGRPNEVHKAVPFGKVLVVDRNKLPKPQ